MRHGILIAFACAFLVGCTKAAPPVSSGGRQPWTIPHVLRVAEMSDPDFLNPYVSEIGVTSDLSEFVYSYLVTTDSRGRLVGDLATAVPSLANGGISRDGRTYVYHLRQNIVWHDGVPFTVRDVAASWHAMMNPHNNTVGHEGYDRVEWIEARGLTTVVVHLRARYPPFVSHFFAQPDGKPVLPAHILARAAFNAGELSRHPIGTGPFSFVSWERGDRIVLTRFNRYFKGRPKLSRIEMRFIPNAQTTADELAAHQIDLIVTTQAALLDQYRLIEGVIVQTAPLTGQELLIINARKPGLRDLAVRRALAIAVPYATIMHDVERDIVNQARSILPQTSLGYDPLPVRTYDPGAARDILERAGWRRGAGGIRTRDGVRLAFNLALISGFTSAERIGLVLQASLRTVGIELAIKTYPYRTIYAAPHGPLYSGSYDLALWGGSFGWDPDLYNVLACDRWYPRGENIYGFCDLRVDALEREGLQTDEPSRRAAVYREASALIWSEVPWVPLFGGRNLIVRSADLRNYSVRPTSNLGWKSWEWDI